MPVTKNFTVHVAKFTDSRLERAIDRMARRLEGRLGFEIPRHRAVARDTAAVLVEVERASPSIPGLGDDESYAIEVTAAQATLRAPTVVGALRGLETLLQLLDGDREGWFLPVARIADRPRFPWRGLMLDVARHWLPMDVVKRNLDGMAALKLNVLHLHLTEDQGFRIESRRYPRLHQLGSDGLYFTQVEMREIVAYAAERGIRVVPEFDMPGHVTSWLVGHPELAAAPGPYAIQRNWGIFDPALDPTREALYTFLDGFLGEMAALFPDSYLHIGGDENNGKHWNASASIQAFMKKRGMADAHALQAYFNQRLLRILQKHRKRMVGWDEILHPDLPKDAVVQSWRGQASLAEGARLGYQGILSNGYYIDLMHPTWRHYAVDPLPAGHTLSADEAARVLGGEATMWAEWVTPETVDSRIWPRTAAIAERFWSPGAVQDVDDMYRRLEKVSVDLEELGLLHSRNPAMLLRRMAGGSDPHALAMLAALVEPVEDYRRGREFTKGHGQPATQQWPLTRLVDAAQPDSLETRRLARAIDRVLDDAPAFERGRAELAATFARWRDTVPVLERLIDRRPILDEARPLAAALARLAEAGRSALDLLAAGTQPAAGWRDEMVGTLDAAAVPVAEVEFPLVPALRRLVFGAAMVSEVGTSSPQEWKKKVVEAATPPPPPSRR